MTTITAKVRGIDCDLHLDNEYRIEKITMNSGKWSVILDDAELRALEEQYDYLIAAAKKENEIDDAECSSSIKADNCNRRFV